MTGRTPARLSAAAVRSSSSAFTTYTRIGRLLHNKPITERSSEPFYAVPPRVSSTRVVIDPTLTLAIYRRGTDVLICPNVGTEGDNGCRGSVKIHA